MVRVMAFITAGVEYGIHCLLFLVDTEDTPLSARDLAALQGISPSFLAKIFPKLEKAGIVRASEGVRGGYLLAKPAEAIDFLQLVDAIDGRKSLFDCQEIRGKCAVFGGVRPDWAAGGVCAVHAVMLQAEKAMRDTLAGTTLRDIAAAVDRKAPPEFARDIQSWLDTRLRGRTGKRGPSQPETPS